MTCAVLLAIPAIALADNAVADGDGPVPLAESNMAFGDVGCNVAADKTALIAISRQGSATATNTFANSASVKVSVLSVTGTGLSAVMGSSDTITLPSGWTSSGNGTLSSAVSSTVTVNSSTPGPGTGTVTYRATGTNTSGATITRDDTMNVSWTTGSCDTTAPSVTSISAANTNPTNTTGNLSWDVTFSESVTGVDASDFNLANTGLGGSPAITNVSGSGASYTVTASSGSDSGTLGLNLTDNDSIVDGAGNKLGGTNPGNGDFTGDVYVIDRAAPTMTGSAVKGPDFTDPYTADSWTNKDVRVTFTCADTGGSGITGTSGNDVQNFTTETDADGVDATSGGTCVDNAGNTATASTFGPIKIDKSAPTVGLGPESGTTGTNGWYTSAVTQEFNATDGLSGLVGPATFSKTSGAQEGDNVMIASGDVSDNAGNTASRSAGPFNIDLTNPTIQASLVDGSNNPLAAASTGWYNNSTGAPTAHYTCDDADGDGDGANGGASGVASCGPDHLFSSDANPQSNTGTVTDNAGRNATASVNNVKVDLSDPTNIAFQGAPAAGSSHDFGSLPTAAPTCTADDTFSGLKDCVVSGYSTAVGNHTLTAKATDNAGNSVTETRSYTVAAATAKGFYSPIDMNNAVNTVKGGSTVPAKFELFGGASNTEQKNLSAVSSMSAKQINCTTLTGATDAIEEIVSTSATGLRFDTTGDQFIYNWKTPKSPGTCYSLTMTAADNTTKLVAYFKLT
jgi:hypothetical protein